MLCGFLRTHLLLNTRKRNNRNMLNLANAVANDKCPVTTKMFALLYALWLHLVETILEVILQNWIQEMLLHAEELKSSDGN